MIRGFVERWRDVAVGIGDDAAIMDVPAGEKLVISTDASVENIHFRRGDISPREIGYRAAAAALSDLAAMASLARGLLFSIILPAAWRGESSEIAEGVGAAAKSVGCPVIGGNISSGAELSITTTVVGSSKQPATRVGARSGDHLYVTGKLGGAGAAVDAWASGRTPAPQIRARFVAPSPRITEAQWLSEKGISAAIDISDGLTTDARHLAEAGGVEITIDSERVPIESGATLDEALSGGEDYELLVTAPSLDTREFEKKFNLPLTDIGLVSKGKPYARILRGGVEVPARAGYDHMANR